LNKRQRLVLETLAKKAGLNDFDVENLSKIDVTYNNREKAKKFLELLKARLDKNRFADSGVLVTPDLIIFIEGRLERFRSKMAIQLRAFEEGKDLTVTIQLTKQKISRLRRLLTEAEKAVDLKMIATDLKRKIDESERSRRSFR
jgi:deoxyadenosine/deoxycytidine kinase